MSQTTAPAATAPLADWLAFIEGIHPSEIELGLARVRGVAERLGLLGPAGLGCKVITVGGTNGKGSTCATLEGIYAAAGYKTGLYTSPHLVHFEERCRIAGDFVAAQDLSAAFARVEAARLQAPAISLSYFEYTTLACLLLIQAAQVDVAILEVGLGGRLDATNIIDSDCAIITSVDVDHVDYLGDNREAIGAEKAGILRAGRPAVIGDPVPPQSVLDAAERLGCDTWLFGRDFNFSGDPQQWAWAGRGKRLAGMAYPALRGANQLLNAAGALAAVYALRAQLPVDAQAIRRGLASAELPGRFQVIAGQPLVILDVAHNPHSAAALAANLEAQNFNFLVTHAIFGAMQDKDMAEVLRLLDGHVDRWYFCDLPTPRAAKAEDLLALWKTQTQHKAAGGACYSDPQAALETAFAAATPQDRIVVFGSFYTVGGILAHGEPRPPAPHLPGLA